MKSENKKTYKSVKESENKKTDKSVKKSETYKALVTGPSWNYEVIALRREAAEGSGSRNVKWYWDTRADPKPPSECSVLPGDHK